MVTCTAGTLTLLLTEGKISSQDRPKLPNWDAKGSAASQTGLNSRWFSFLKKTKGLKPPLAPSLLKNILGLTCVSWLLSLYLSPTQATLPLLIMSLSNVMASLLVKVSVLLIHYASLKKISC